MGATFQGKDALRYEQCFVASKNLKVGGKKWLLELSFLAWCLKFKHGKQPKQARM